MLSLLIALIAVHCLYYLALVVRSWRFDQRLPPPDVKVAAAAARGAHAVLDALLQPGAALHVVIDARYGLGNRLRAVASAMSVAAAARRPLLVIWEPDAHVNCSLHSLLAEPLPFAVLEEPLPIGALPADRFQAFNYMPGEAGATKREWVHLDDARHLSCRRLTPMNICMRILPCACIH